MLYLDTSSDVPDREFLEETVEAIAEHGIKISDTSELLSVLVNERRKYLAELNNVYGIANPNSSQQVIAALKELASKEFPVIAEVCVDERTKKWSSNAEKLGELKSADVPIAFTLSKYRELNNMVSSINTINGLKDPYGFVHPDISYGRTGRINYSNPALMNINKKVLWNILEPESPDYTIYSVDIKNQEPWILINMLGIDGLVEVINSDRSNSLYDAIYKAWFGYYPDQLERKEFKTAWNAMTYGASKKLILNSCRHNPNADFLYEKFNSIKELKDYRKECSSKGFSGYRQCTTLFGTKLECDGYRGMALARQHMDYTIQGTGVDILAFLNSNLNDKIEEYGYEELVKPYLFRHDEIDVAVHKNLFELLGEDGVNDFLTDTFEHQIDDWSPFKVEIARIEHTKDYESILKDE